MAELKSGQSLASRFHLIRHLGRGGMGDAWLASDQALGTRVVVKVAPEQASAERIDLLRQECRSARRLSHPHIVRVFDFHQDGPYSFITMEYVDGGHLGKLRGAPPEKILSTVLPLVEALEYAHREGVVHRDLKCGNVLLDSSGRARLTDFGIAALLDPGEDDLRLSGGGSRHRVSPQQLAGEPASPADDIYGMGVLLYELVSGQAPLPTDRSDGQIRSQVPEPLTSDHPLPESLRSLVNRMLAKSVCERPADMGAVRAALEQAVAEVGRETTVPPRVDREAIHLTPPPRVPSVRSGAPGPERASIGHEETAQRRRGHWWLVAAFVLLGAAAFGVFALLPRWVERRESAARSSVTRPQSRSAAVVRPSPAGPQSATEQTTAAAPVAETAAPSETRPPSERAGSETRQPQRSPGQATPPRRVDPSAGDFAEAMSSGLAALDQGDFETAKQRFERALAITPTSAEASDGLARAHEALRLAAIADHRERAQTFESRESWRDAAREYAAALAVDPTLRFAQSGAQRARQRAQLSERLGYHLDHPERLTSEAVIEDARQLLAEAKAIDPPGSRLRQQIEQLEGHIEVATTPLRVVLLSDNLTDVMVYRVGRLGKFERRVLDLRPGTYTVVGSREGYRDVRRQLEVVPGRDAEPLRVRCEEEI